MTTLPANQITESRSLKTFAEEAYLNYSMSVILDRALPHIADGLKPVQRRIIYAMSELGLKNSAKFKKSARTVGDVLGKYHPHGDSACYEAMVLMAQPFSYRYPLIDGQGNWGSMDDPKSFAAMRYTESRLSPYAQALLAELAQGTVEWIPNFDGTLEEPRLLPARLPNVILNGTSGIAVGMATDIPPHNLIEVGNACIHLLEHPDANLADIMRYIQGPDFPTAAEIITPRAELAAIYQTGTGMVRMRATYTVENNEIVITALPFQTSGARIQEQIAAQMQSKKLPQIADLRDESDQEHPTRLIIVLRSNRVDADSVMSHLFATTDLEHSYKVNLNMIGLNGKPQVKSLLTLLQEWLRYRLATVKNRLQFRLDVISRRLNLLEGLMIVYLNLDRVIAIIRHEDDPKSCLMTEFNLNEPQVDAILELKLKQLAKLEELAITTEQQELTAEQQKLTQLLNSETALKKLLQTELKEDMQRYGDKRRSQIIVRTPAQILNLNKPTSIDPLTVILSKQGWIRTAKNHELDPLSLNYRTGDSLALTTKGFSNQTLILLDSTGKTYSLPLDTLPSAKGQGEPITSKLALPPKATICSLLLGDPKQALLLANNQGYGFISSVEQIHTKNRNGKNTMTLAPNAQPLPLLPIKDLTSQLIIAITTSLHILIFPVANLPQLAKGKGNKIINIPAAALKDGSEKLEHLLLIAPDEKLQITTNKRTFSYSYDELKTYWGERGLRGKILPREIVKIVKIQVSV